MKPLILVNAFSSSGHFEQLFDGAPSVSWTEKALASAFPGADFLWIESREHPLPASWRPEHKIESLETLNSAAYLTRMESWSQGYDLVVMAWADQPFLRPDLMNSLLDWHTRYRADYTFADGFPQGLAPELIHPRILPVLRTWAEKKPGALDRDFWFQLMSTDMNAFDVETYLSPVDLRMARLSFTTDTQRNALLCQRFWTDRLLPLEEFLQAVKTKGAWGRTLPASLMVQITNGTLQTPVYSPWRDFFPQALSDRNFMAADRWENLLDQALAFSGDLHVFPSLWGEPSLHPQVGTLLKSALERPGVHLVVETSGLGWSPGLLEDLAQGPGHDRLDWIVELDSQNPETYRLWRGNGFEEAQATAQLLQKLFPGHFWPQTVRMKENEEEMESFFRTWKDQAGQVILQKYNHYSGRLPQRKVADLSPWNRTPCWHLARDLCVLLDGTVIPCRDDARGEMGLGNAFQEDLAVIWERGGNLWNRHFSQDYPELCKNCDEYYTFNF